MAPTSTNQAVQPDHYVVIGNPIAHSKSPRIHAAFAEANAQALTYERVLAPPDGFADTLAQLRAAGVRGANVTVPFKLEACALATRLTPRAELAGAVNTLAFNGDEIFGDNTDGAGLVNDIARLGVSLNGRRILLLGAGGASRGAIGPLLAATPASLTIANRSVGKAQELAAAGQLYAGTTRLSGCALADLMPGFDVMINATSASLAGAELALPAGIWVGVQLAYDMMYGAQPTSFLRQAKQAGVACCADGLGMLVEQAAEAFAIWRGVRPATTAVLAALRAELDATA